MYTIYCIDQWSDRSHIRELNRISYYESEVVDAIDWLAFQESKLSKYVEYISECVNESAQTTNSSINE